MDANIKAVRLCATWLLLAGIIWVRSCVQVMGVVSPIRTLIIAVEVFLWLFAGPIILILVSGVLIALPHSRVAAAGASISVAWMIWTFASNYLPQALQERALGDWLFLLSALIVVLSVIAVVLIWRTIFITLRSVPPEKA